MTMTRKKMLGLALTLLWGLLMAYGLKILWDYDGAPGRAAAPPAQWPTDSALPRDPAVPTLVMFVHPRCPCTQASVAEFTLGLAQAAQPVRTTMVFLAPAHLTPAWVDGALWQRANALPGVAAWRDLDGIETARFRVATSGTIVLYDAAGHLLFHGGITLNRGHAGDNPGRRALVAWLSGTSTAPHTTPVFGCPLFDAPASCPRCNTTGGTDVTPR